MVGDVLEKAPLGLDFTNNAGNVWPEVAGVIGSAFFPCDAERLAGIARCDAIHCSTPACAVKGSNTNSLSKKGQ
jgi:hypothetical protein